MAKIKDKLQDGTKKIKEFYSGDKKKKRIGITSAVLAIVIAASVFSAVKLNKKEYVSLFTDLTTEDLSSVVATLEEQGVTDYKIKDDSILVNSKDEFNIRASIMTSGYPKSGFGYETYNSQLSLMTSESARQTAELQDLQDRMGATIRCLEDVKDAKVTIQAGSDNRYVLDSENSVPASATVFVEMKNNQEIPDKYVEAIGNMILTAVSGLEFENITITDSFGNTFFPGQDNSEESTSSASDLKLRLEQQVNNRVRNEVLQALTPVYGSDNVKVSVNSTVDVSKRVQESVTYTTPEGAPAGEGIIGHYEYDQSLTRPTDGQTNGGVAGAGVNTDVNTYLNSAGAVQGNEQTLTNSGVEDHKVNTNTEQSEQNFGVVTDVMIAVTINEQVSGNVGAEQLVNHIARAAGIDAAQQADKINVLIAPFYDPDARNNNQDNNTNTIAGFKMPPWGVYVIGAMVGLLLVLIILLIISTKRRKKAKLIAEQEAQAQAEAEQKALEEELFKKAALSEAERLAAEEAAKRDILDIQNERNLELKQDIRKFTEENPEIAASMIRIWLKGEGGEANG